MSGLFLSRARLKREPAVEALAPLLLPEAGGERAHAAHRLVWSLFAGEPAAERRFLFRETQPGGMRRGRAEFMILSRDFPPAPDGPLLEVETKPFAPALAAGDMLAFSLRANATVARREEGRPKRSDIVMHALTPIARDERPAVRDAATLDVAWKWLRAQGERAGFRLLGPRDEGTGFRVDAYDVWQFPRLGRTGRLGVLDMSGVLEVTDPPAFLDRLAAGFGRARSFGCGLMLIRRFRR